MSLCHVALFTIAKRWEQRKCPPTAEQQHAAHPHQGAVFTLKRKETAHAATRRVRQFSTKLAKAGYEEMPQEDKTGR